MELNPEIAYYVVHFHGHLMTGAEAKAQRHLFATMKATMGRSDEAAQREAQKDKIHSRMLSDEPNVRSLTRDGYERFQLTTAARILGDTADKVLFNYCPRCGKLARTSTAKQCRHCGHDWHRTSLT
jgi:NADH pyrophosphatase NudC (nudix superfamily)